MLEGDWVGATSSSLSVNKFCSGICHLNKEHRVISSVDLALVLTCSLCRVRGDKPCNASTCTFEHEESRATLRDDLKELKKIGIILLNSTKRARHCIGA